MSFMGLSRHGTQPREELTTPNPEDTLSFVLRFWGYPCDSGPSYTEDELITILSPLPCRHLTLKLRGRPPEVDCCHGSLPSAARRQQGCSALLSSVIKLRNALNISGDPEGVCVCLFLSFFCLVTEFNAHISLRNISINLVKFLNSISIVSD